MVSHRDGVLPTLNQVGSVSPARPALSTPPILSQPFPSMAPVFERPLTPTQVESIRAAMRVFVEDDLARGIAPSSRFYCDGCERGRPAAGFIQYGRYSLCNH